MKLPRWKTSRRKSAQAGPEVEPDVTSDPTPIPIHKRTRTVLLLVIFLLLAYIVYRVPGVLTTALGGVALALILSFPVRFLSRFMPRGLAILISFLLLLGILALAGGLIVPIVAAQVGSLIQALPSIANDAQRYVNDVLDLLRDRGLLTGDSNDLISRVRDDVVNGIRSVAGNIVGGAFNVLTGTFGFALTLFGVLFVGIYLLIDVRRMKAAFLRTSPHRYRRDARTLWDAFGYSLSKYLSGLALVLVIQGVVSAVGLYLIGVPYALALGTWVSITAIIPYLGAWLGAVPAVVVALTTEDPATTVILTIVLFIVIQQLEGNVLTPKIQGDALKVHPVLVFLAVLAGGGLAGILGVVFAVPALAVLRVLFDFFRVRLRTEG